MKGLMDKLEELNLVARNRCATNRRLIEVVITEQGLAKLSHRGPKYECAFEINLGTEAKTN